LTEEAGQDTAEETAKAMDIPREKAQVLLGEGAQLVDVRVDHEWDAGHIPGAKHLPLEELAERSDELDPGRPVVLYCRGGTRSTMAAEALEGAGFDAVKLSEGIVGWDEAGLELDSEDSYVAESGEAAAVLQARKRAASGS
jgi:rhodanese-related sulfurtransferase